MSMVLPSGEEVRALHRTQYARYTKDELKQRLEQLQRTEGPGAAERWAQHLPPHWRCIRGHVTSSGVGLRYGKAVCLQCKEYVQLTFPEDRSGPLLCSSPLDQPRLIALAATFGLSPTRRRRFDLIWHEGAWWLTGGRSAAIPLPCAAHCDTIEEALVAAEVEYVGSSVKPAGALTQAIEEASDEILRRTRK